MPQPTRVPSTLPTLLQILAFELHSIDEPQVKLAKVVLVGLRKGFAYYGEVLR